MTMGIYDIYLNSISNINVSILIPMGIGLILGSLLILKLMQYCLNRYYSETYYSIIGFVVGSVFILLPNLTFSINGIISICIFVIGLLIGFMFEKFEN